MSNIFVPYVSKRANYMAGNQRFQRFSEYSENSD